MIDRGRERGDMGGKSIRETMEVYEKEIIKSGQ